MESIRAKVDRRAKNKIGPDKIDAMTPQRVKELRERLGLTQTALGEALRLGPHGKRTVARWEAGGTIPGPAQVALEALDDGWRPGSGRWAQVRDEYVSALDSLSLAVSEARNRVQIVGRAKDSAT